MDGAMFDRCFFTTAAQAVITAVITALMAAEFVSKTPVRTLLKIVTRTVRMDAAKDDGDMANGSVRERARVRVLH